MSLKENDNFLESRFEQFKRSQDGRERAYVIWELKENGFSDKANNLILSWWEERRQYLEDHGKSEDDVYIDDDNKEFFFDTVENGTPGDDYEVEEKKKYLPDYLDVEHWHDYTYPWHTLPVKPWERH